MLTELLDQVPPATAAPVFWSWFGIAAISAVLVLLGTVVDWLLRKTAQKRLLQWLSQMEDRLARTPVLKWQISVASAVISAWFTLVDVIRRVLKSTVVKPIHTLFFSVYRRLRMHPHLRKVVMRLLMIAALGIAATLMSLIAVTVLTGRSLPLLDRLQFSWLMQILGLPFVLLTIAVGIAVLVDLGRLSRAVIGPGFFKNVVEEPWEGLWVLDQRTRGRRWAYGRWVPWFDDQRPRGHSAVIRQRDLRLTDDFWGVLWALDQRFHHLRARRRPYDSVDEVYGNALATLLLSLVITGIAMWLGGTMGQLAGPFVSSRWFQLGENGVEATISGMVVLPLYNFPFDLATVLISLRLLAWARRRQGWFVIIAVTDVIISAILTVVLRALLLADLNAFAIYAQIGDSVAWFATLVTGGNATGSADWSLTPVLLTTFIPVALYSTTFVVLAGLGATFRVTGYMAGRFGEKESSPFAQLAILLALLVTTGKALSEWPWFAQWLG